jgi:hypothetical protein
MNSKVLAAVVFATALQSPVAAAPVVYTNLAAFTAATTGTTTQNFEGAPTATSVWILQTGSYSVPGLTITATNDNAFLSDPAGASRFFYYDWGTGDVINTPYGGTLTVSFAAPVTAFGLDLGSFYGAPFPYPPGTIPGEATTLYGADIRIGTAQGDFVVDAASTRNFTFFGVTSATPFSAFTLTGATAQAGASIVFDNVRFGAAVPEPATWAMLLSGFALTGAAARRRQRAVMAHG